METCFEKELNASDLSSITSYMSYANHSYETIGRSSNSMQCQTAVAFGGEIYYDAFYFAYNFDESTQSFHYAFGLISQRSLSTSYYCDDLKPTTNDSAFTFSGKDTRNLLIQGSYPYTWYVCKENTYPIITFSS